MDITAKLRPLYLLQILKEQTDEDNCLSTKQLCDILMEDYGIETHRTTVKGDIDVLRKAGYDITERRSSVNYYNYVGRDFDDAELKAIIDAIASAKFIPEDKSEKLIKKITALAGPGKAGSLKRNVAVDGRVKTENKLIFYITDVINDAINMKRKISFQMVEYNVNKERVLHNGGEQYTFSPYSLIWDGDYYYMVGWSDKYGSIGSHRLDRISGVPDILEEEAVAQPEDFDASDFVKTALRMFNAPRERVELICDNDVMDAVIDKFGPNVFTCPYDSEHFLVIEEVSVGSVFLNWIFGFGGKVRITGPDSVREVYRRMLKQALKMI